MSNSIRSLKVTGFLLVTVLGISSAHAIQLINVEHVSDTFFVRHCLTVKGGARPTGRRYRVIGANPFLVRTRRLPIRTRPLPRSGIGNFLGSRASERTH